MNSPKANLPKHVAIIMDGNGRWAEERRLPRIEGHKKGVEVSETIIECAHDLKIKYLTLYAFSRENWNRPAEEVNALMILLKEFLLAKRQKMLDRKIRLNAIGNLQLLPPDVAEVLTQVRKDTAKGNELMLTLALSYGSRDEIVRAINKLLNDAQKGKAPSVLDEKVFSSLLDTCSLPDPDLIIRTSGEHRLSNFLLWQGAYAEYVFEECYWPDFTGKHFMAAIEEYQKRERRFGMTGEQLEKGKTKQY